MADSLATIRQRLGRLMEGEDAILGTPGSALTTSTFASDDLQVYPDDYFNDWHGRFYSGTHKDTNFTVTDFAKLNVDENKGTVTFAPALSAAADATDLFELYQNYTPPEMIDAINESIEIVASGILQDKIDESIITAARTFEYLIPSGLLYIAQIYQESGTAGRYSASDNLIDTRHWSILRQATPQLWFDNNYVNLTTGRRLRLVGQAIQSQLTIDTDICNINRALIIYQSKALLHQSRIRGQGAEFEQHRSQMALAQQRADTLRDRLQVGARGQKVTY
jgi:hypothetical protein